MKDRIRISDLGSYYLQNVKRRLNLMTQPNYVPMRLAFGRSLQVRRDPVFKETNQEILDKAKVAKGGEQPAVSIFEQGQGYVFQALLSQKYRRKIEGDEYVDLLEAHVEHGLHIIYHETERLTGYDYLSAIAAKAQADLKSSSDNGAEVTVSEKNEKADVLSIRIGINKKTKQSIDFQINTAANPHFGIMGGSGSGKTYFLKHLLKQIRLQSHYETHFVFFDYAKGDIANDEAFLRDTQAEVINVKKRPLPLNIFANAAKDEKEQKATAERIVGVFKNVEANFGKVQEESLYNSIIRGYENNVPYPDFEAIRMDVQMHTKKADTLTSILRPLVEQNYFARTTDLIWGTWTNKTLIIDIHEIERKDLVCFLVLDRIFSELKQLGDAPYNAESGARKIRTVVVIDEAHNFLAEKKRALILQKMIREVRSMGGMVILASQSPDDYDSADFDFLELLEFPVVLKSTPKSYKFLEQKFLLTTPEAKDLLKSVGRLEIGEGFVMEGKKVVMGELCK
jgi:Helicase HerA, central domain